MKPSRRSFFGLLAAALGAGSVRRPRTPAEPRLWRVNRRYWTTQPPGTAWVDMRDPAGDIEWIRR